MKKNEGLSLIELIVVIAIMGVMVSVIGISITVVSRQRVSNAASEVKVQFQAAQTIAMSKDNCRVQIKRLSDGDTEVTVFSSEEKILDRITISKKVTVEVDYGSGFTSIADCGTVMIYYVRATGAFDHATVGGATKDHISRIRFANKSRSEEITLLFTKLTGKVSYE